ncbi:MAG: thioredoxin family protein [Phycisphaerae bacterium]|nr:thioredoxin family protein [Phycisphaerae bacterium]
MVSAMITRFLRLWAVLAVVLYSGSLVRAQTDQEDERHARIDLLASVAEVVPGEPFDLGLRFEINDHWHIYWINAGDSGLPPRVDWSMPSGFSVGELRFPVPKRHVSGGDIVTNILEGTPVLLAGVVPSSDVRADSVRIAGDVRYLICNTSCLREQVSVELTLPVASAGGEPVPSHEDVFASARRALPKETSRFLDVSLALSKGGFNPGDDFDLLLNIDIKPQFHIQSNAPLNPAFVATEAFIEPVAGIGFGQPEFPPHKTRELPVIGKVAEFAGKLTVRVPAKVYEAPTVEPIRFGGVLKYQACNETGNCFPPEAVEFSHPFSPDHAVVAHGGDSVAPAVPDGNVVGAQGPTGEAETAQGAPAAGDSETASLTDWLRRLGLPGLLFGCFLYGLAINLTPCVLPLLSIKVLGFVQQAHESRARTAVLGLSFGAGAVLFFVVLGLLAVAGTNILQYPVAVIALGAVVMALALSLLGVWTLQPPSAATSLDARLQQEGIVASFGKGILAPVLGFACTGPFMAAAYGWAVLQPRGIAMLAFLVMGLGMAAPYVLLGFNPRWLSFLPKPGQWMITFERIMGFLLLAMVIWLINPLVTQLGAAGSQWTIVFLIGVALACWIWGQVNLTMSEGRRLSLRALALLVVVLTGGTIYGWIYPIGEAMARQQAQLEARYAAGEDWAEGVPWRRWSRDAVHDAVCAGKTVFVDFTAAYCTQCKVNKKLAIETSEVRNKMRTLDVIPFQADFSFQDPDIADELHRHGAAAVPLNLIYEPGKPENPTVLPTALSKSAVIQSLEKAGPSRVLLASAPDCDT